MKQQLTASFHDFAVSLGGDADVSEPGLDHVELDTGLEQMQGGRVPVMWNYT
jgi:hypothetical protein